MAFTASLTLPHPTATVLPRIRSSISDSPKQVAPPPRSSHRRNFLLLTATTAVTALTSRPAGAQDIPLFGLRKRLEQVEKQTEEIVREGLEAAEKGVETAEKGIVAAENEIETVAEGFGLGALAQAGIVAGAELLGVVIASSVVNSILGPEPQKQ